MKEGGKEVVPPVTLKHCSNFYYEGSKAYEGRYVRRYRRYLEVESCFYLVILVSFSMGG